MIIILPCIGTTEGAGSGMPSSVARGSLIGPPAHKNDAGGVAEDVCVGSSAALITTRGDVDVPWNGAGLDAG